MQTYYKNKICPGLNFGKSKNNIKVKDYQAAEAIIYRLKKGCQWHQLPMKQFIKKNYQWQSVYYHFQKWKNDGIWRNVLLPIPEQEIKVNPLCTQNPGIKINYFPHKV